MFFSTFLSAVYLGYAIPATNGIYVAMAAAVKIYKIINKVQSITNTFLITSDNHTISLTKIKYFADWKIFPSILLYTNYFTVNIFIYLFLILSFVLLI